MIKVSGTLRIELSQYREMAVFTRFGSDVDESTAKLLRKGECLTELLKQGRGEPMSLFAQTAILYAYKLDVFENVPVKKVKETAKQLLSELYSKCASCVAEVNNTGDLSDAVESQIKELMCNFKESLK